jgi:gluconate kinase
MRVTEKLAYEITFSTLRKLDEKQLIELFHDIDDLNVIERIADTAYHFVDTHELDECKPDLDELSDDEDALEVDNARRAREL